MVARGDLGVEIDFTELPGIQKTIIDRSFSFGKPSSPLPRCWTA